MTHPSPERAAGILQSSATAVEAGESERSRAGARDAVLVVGSSEPGLRALEQRLAEHNHLSPQIIGVLADVAPAQSLAWPHLGSLAALEDHLAAGGVRHIAVCLGGDEWSNLESVVARCVEHGVELIIPIPETARHARRGGLLSRSMKRGMDILGSLVGLTLSAPVLAVAAVAIVLFDGRPVLFRQLRAGKDGRPFRILKLRTMGRGADAQRSALRQRNELRGGAAFKMSSDPRVTRLGRWLRRTSIDELPQLWNVLRGEMSLVGPRPHPYDDLAGYRPWHLGRLAVKPGLTGIWQVELRGDPDFDRGVERDLEYIANWSLLLDVTILLRTVPAVLRGTGR